MGCGLAKELGGTLDMTYYETCMLFATWQVMSFDPSSQPVKQMCFHRPLSVLFNEVFSVGLVMSGFVEPVANKGELPEDFLWAKLSEIPPAIISCWEIKFQG